MSTLYNKGEKVLINDITLGLWRGGYTVAASTEDHLVRLTSDTSGKNLHVHQDRLRKGSAPPLRLNLAALRSTSQFPVELARWKESLKDEG